MILVALVAFVVTMWLQVIEESLELYAAVLKRRIEHEKAKGIAA